MPQPGYLMDWSATLGETTDSRKTNRRQAQDSDCRTTFLQDGRTSHRLIVLGYQLSVEV